MTERVFEMIRGSNPVEAPVLVSLFITIASLTIDQGEAINCFVCNSKMNPRCADPILTDPQDYGEQESEESDRELVSLKPVECHLDVKYSEGIQAVSDMLRRLGQPGIGGPDLWMATTARVAPPGGQGSGFGISGPGGGSYGNRGYGRGGSKSGGSWAYSQGAFPEPQEAMGCHKVDYTENGEAYVDRGCAPSSVADMDPCSALDLATKGGEGGGGGNTGSSGGSGGFGGNGGYGSSSGSGSGGSSGSSSGSNSGSAFDITKIKADFCDICTDGDGCNGAVRLASVNVLSILALLLILKLCFSLS